MIDFVEFQNQIHDMFDGYVSKLEFTNICDDANTRFYFCSVSVESISFSISWSWDSEYEILLPWCHRSSTLKDFMHSDMKRLSENAKVNKNYQPASDAFLALQELGRF